MGSKQLVTCLVVVLAPLGLAACSSGGGKASSTATSIKTTTTSTKAAAVTTTSSTAPAVTTTSTTAAAVVTTTAGPNEFLAAKNAWQQGAAADAADQGIFWGDAVTDLNAGIASGSDDTGFTTAVQQLQQLQTIPETSDTAQQMAEAQADVSALNTFFGTSGLYS